MKLWITRNKLGELNLFKGEKPKFYAKTGWWLSEDYYFETILPRELFPEITFENSPQEVELKLIK